MKQNSYLNEFGISLLFTPKEKSQINLCTISKKRGSYSKVDAQVYLTQSYFQVFFINSTEEKKKIKNSSTIKRKFFNVYPKKLSSLFDFTNTIDSKFMITR